HLARLSCAGHWWHGRWRRQRGTARLAEMRFCVVNRMALAAKLAQQASTARTAELCIGRVGSIAPQADQMNQQRRLPTDLPARQTTCLSGVQMPICGDSPVVKLPGCD